MFKGLVLPGTNKTGEAKLKENKSLQWGLNASSAVPEAWIETTVLKETYVAAKGQAVTVVRNTVPSDLYGPESGAWSIFL